MTLDKLSKNGVATITSLTHPDTALLSRIMALGIMPGEQIEVINVAPLGCPMQVKIGDTFVSVRKADAQFVEIEVL
ncbi:FeoA family protein [Pseudoalteromonas piscicida]|uniref:Ferrous iron transport protein A n=1 Tax=Pseudoalteromonas piscicida TaxID=43662 RepID=A0A2A5JTR5_PSEO7|nr:FeoA family protein [Pseudoalteromonas piscicida]PCK32808.1 ferrous iron transport protein A [Pseudoalteromonas piscicida]